MSRKNWYRETIEALGMMAPRARIVNKLNTVAAQSDDHELRKLAEQLISEIMAAESNTTSIAPKNMKNGVPSGRKALKYCQDRAYEAPLDAAAKP
ncbi:hypothetical protein [Azonexus hydrophilus]|uniref:hypothetical protein n=1 Tax=Azonexus hydrophilus TaxID=418702 RepID=UPI0011156398|nr:hypothetical protein [Azonexus hydrophilus]